MPEPRRDTDLVLQAFPGPYVLWGSGNCLGAGLATEHPMISRDLVSLHILLSTFLTRDSAPTTQPRAQPPPIWVPESPHLVCHFALSHELRRWLGQGPPNLTLNTQQDPLLTHPYLLEYEFQSQL